MRSDESQTKAKTIKTEDLDPHSGNVNGQSMKETERK